VTAGANRRQHSAAAERNKEPILAVLQRVLPTHGLALEIAAGTGQHAVHFASGMPGWTWLPTDADAGALASIAAWRADAALANLRPPQRLDVMDPTWTEVPTVDAVICINLLHIAPLSACACLMHGAARHLAPHGVLVTYGPYLVDGEPTAAGNLAFDADLRGRNAAWGLRRVALVAAEAAQAGLALCAQVAMPANNLTLVFRRAAARAA
jgi:SAM-dependent methyltransferase